MADNRHKGSELNNVRETWEQNEQRRQQGLDSGSADRARRDEGAEDDLQKAIHQEAAEYDDVNKEDRLLSGDRASVNDEADDNATAG